MWFLESLTPETRKYVGKRSREFLWIKYFLLVKTGKTKKNIIHFWWLVYYIFFLYKYKIQMLDKTNFLFKNEYEI